MVTQALEQHSSLSTNAIANATVTLLATHCRYMSMLDPYLTPYNSTVQPVLESFIFSHAMYLRKLKELSSF